jgi:uncharacterized protein YndB with AHSA1/START domain
VLGAHAEFTLDAVLKTRRERVLSGGALLALGSGKQCGGGFALAIMKPESIINQMVLDRSPHVTHEDYTMNTAPTLPLKELQISTPTDTTIVLTRSFNAPRRLVWEAMFTPDKMRRWMIPPPEWTTTTCECDPRVGGALEVAWKSAEADPAMTLRGVFTEVVLHERIVHTETMALGSGQTIGCLVEKHEFSEEGGVTTMRITQTFASKEPRDSGIASAQGMEACYCLLEALLARP